MLLARYARTAIGKSALSHAVAAAGIAVSLLGAHPLSAAAAPENSSACGFSLQSLVDAAQSGGTVQVPGCVFRESVKIEKPLTLQGQPGAEVRGSDVWLQWQRVGANWVSSDTVPSLPSVGNV